MIRAEDRNGGDRHGRADEERESDEASLLHRQVRKHQIRQAVAQSKRRDDSHDRYEQRRSAAGLEMLEVELETDEKEKKDQAELAEHGEDVAEALQSRVARVKELHPVLMHAWNAP
jgi:hypothetical protein